MYDLVWNIQTPDEQSIRFDEFGDVYSRFVRLSKNGFVCGVWANDRWMFVHKYPASELTPEETKIMAEIDNEMQNI